jgi:ribonuclease HII
MEQVIAEAFRLRLMRGVEELLRGVGYGRIAGVDEAGRGSLAGPVVAAAVEVQPDVVVPGVDDSKQLRPVVRGRLAKAIRAAHPNCMVAAVPPAEIDRMNILEATKSAMRQALRALRPAPEIVLVDAVRLNQGGGPQNIPHLPLIRGDQISYAIACASILAKQWRDEIMIELDHRYPHYGFAEHKGYGAVRHRQALAEYGPSAVHRLTFRSVVPRGGTGNRPSCQVGRT